VPKRVRGKKIYSTGVAHPAVYSDAILPVLADMLDHSHGKILDPFAGIGKIHQLSQYVDWPIETVGIELEREWAQIHPNNRIGNALNLPFDDDVFDAVITSPTYGNRMADSHIAKDGSIRRSYTHDLGRKLTPDNSGYMQWGDVYRDFHIRVWLEASRVLRPGGRFVLNISDHIRNHTRQYVSSWHTQTLLGIGFVLVDAMSVGTGRHREGANSKARTSSELVLAFDLDDSNL